jgi:hypothetical protein
LKFASKIYSVTPDLSTLRKNDLPKCYEETNKKKKKRKEKKRKEKKRKEKEKRNIEQKASIVQERKYLCVYRRNNGCKWKECCKFCYWGSEN